MERAREFKERRPRQEQGQPAYGPGPHRVQAGRPRQGARPAAEGSHPQRPPVSPQTAQRPKAQAAPPQGPPAQRLTGQSSSAKRPPLQGSQGQGPPAPTPTKVSGPAFPSPRSAPTNPAVANSQRYYSAPYQPYQNTAYGQASQGQAPYYKQTNYGQEPKYDQAGYGQEAYYGQASYGQEAYYGQDTYYDQTPYGQDNYYQPRNTLGGDPYEHLTQAATWTKWIAPILSGIVFIACLVILLKLLS